MKRRSIYFLFSGALGGLIGFCLMELVSAFFDIKGSQGADLLHMAVYFAGFGLAVGGALGMTEGVLQKNRRRLRYGLLIGVFLGALGGFVGGFVGQAMIGFFPLRYAYPSQADLVFVLDSSGSMRQLLFWGNDPWGQRKKAARRLVGRLSNGDRVAVVDFDHQARVLLPLLALDSPEARSRAQYAIDQIDNSGGTNLDIGLGLGLEVLAETRDDGRDKHVIFLTDGQGEYTAAAFPPSVTEGIVIHAIGLGPEVDADLLRRIAEPTGGSYYPVSRASELLATFEKIFSEHIVMTQAAENGGQGELLTPAWLPWLLRVSSWGIMGLAIGFGQGVRENTREDLRACALGGCLGGLLGGALFDPLSEAFVGGAGAWGRGLADVVVGAMIGGSMRLAQARWTDNRPTTRLTPALPEKNSLVRSPRSGTPPPSLRPTETRPTEDSPARSTKSSGAPGKKSLAEYREETSDTAVAMARAYRSGTYRLSEIARHFGVPTTSVRRAVHENPRDGSGHPLSKKTIRRIRQ